jgi:hypothetical protein
MNKAAYIKKEEDSGWGLFGLILLFSGLFKLKAIFENWQHYASVNKIVAGIYYFIINQPIKYIFPLGLLFTKIR